MNAIRNTHDARRKLILALDVDSLKKAKYFIDKLSSRIKIYKVGLQLFTLAGPEIIRYIHRRKAGVFLDLKLFDIPNTVANAVKAALRLKVKMLTLHISGGRDMLQAAVKAAYNESRRLKLKRPLLIGVTVLTSQKASQRSVLRLTKEGLACGLDGVVCSVKEAGVLRKRIKKRFIIITPGIRPLSAGSDDQKRIATANEAIKAGSDFLVIGRPIIEARDPVAAVEEFFNL